MSSRVRLFQYAFTIFCASAALMIMEIVAARLLAPYVGVSLYTWTTLIGVILAGLSVGNWFGGIWVDRGAGVREAGITLAISGLLCLSSLLLLTWIAPLLQSYQTNLILANLLYVTGLFFLPALLLGVITPLLTALALNLDNRTGHVLGRMHALATLGSIAGTFAAGYWLVQYFGTRAVLVATAAGLIILSLPMLVTARKVVISLLISLTLLLMLTDMRGGLKNPCDRESNYFCIRVVDEQIDPQLGEVRSMTLDHLTHGTNVRLDPSLLLAPYVHGMDELIQQHFDDSSSLRYFFAGGGAYTHPRAVHFVSPESDIHVAELDEAVTEVASQQLFFNSKGLTIHHRDARPVLESYPESYFDVVVGDVFHDIAIPYHLVTQEFLQLVKTRLKPDGLFVMNVVDAFPDPRLVKSLLKTAQTRFSNVQVWMDHLPGESTRLTYIISAGDTHQPPDVIIARNGFERRWINIINPLINSGTMLAELPLLTDDFAPVDRLLSSLLMSTLGL